MGKTKRKLHDRKTEQFKAFTKYDNFSAFAGHIKTTGHNTEWDNFNYHYKIKETLFIYELKQVLMSMSVVKSFRFINKDFLLSFDRQFKFEKSLIITADYHESV